MEMQLQIVGIIMVIEDSNFYQWNPQGVWGLNPWRQTLT
jgi:hypothetical protein